MSDLLRMDYINSLQQPFWVRLGGLPDWWWPVYDIDAETGLMRLDVMGKLQVIYFSEVSEIKSDGGPTHDPDDWYNEELRRE